MWKKVQERIFPFLIAFDQYGNELWEIEKIVNHKEYDKKTK